MAEDNRTDSQIACDTFDEAMKSARREAAHIIMLESTAPWTSEVHFYDHDLSKVRAITESMLLHMEEAHDDMRRLIQLIYN